MSATLETPSGYEITVQTGARSGPAGGGRRPAERFYDSRPALGKDFICGFAGVSFAWGDEVAKGQG